MTPPIYRHVACSFWEDPDIRRRAPDPESFVVLLHLFTGPRTTFSGLYRVPLEYVAFETRVPPELVEEIVLRFAGDVVEYDFRTQEIFVRSALRYNLGLPKTRRINPRDNRVKSALHDVGEIFSDRLVAAFSDVYPELPLPDPILARAARGRREASEGSGNTRLRYGCVSEGLTQALPAQNHAVPDPSVTLDSEGLTKGSPDESPDPDCYIDPEGLTQALPDRNHAGSGPLRYTESRSPSQASVIYRQSDRPRFDDSNDDLDDDSNDKKKPSESCETFSLNAATQATRDEAEGKNPEKVDDAARDRVESGNRVAIPEKPDGVDRNPVVTNSELEQVAVHRLGLGRAVAAKDRIRISRELAEFARRVSDPLERLAALEGASLLRDEGLAGLKKGEPYSPGILWKFDRVWYGEGEQRTERTLLDAAVEHYRTREDRLGGLESLGGLLRKIGGE